MANWKVGSVTKKCQFTIPKSLREKYSIKKVFLEEAKKRYTDKTSASQKEQFDSLKGCRTEKSQSNYG